MFTFHFRNVPCIHGLKYHGVYITLRFTMFLCKQTILLPLTKMGINCECQARIKSLYCCTNTICMCALQVIIDLNNVTLVFKLNPIPGMGFYARNRVKLLSLFRNHNDSYLFSRQIIRKKALITFSPYMRAT